MTLYKEDRENVLYALCLHLNGQFYLEKFQNFQKEHQLSLKEMAKIIFSNSKIQKVMYQAEKILCEAEECQNFVISSCNQLYPKILKKITQPPYIIFAVGNIKLLLNTQKIAVIGTRNPSLFTIYCTQKFSTLLSSMGYNIVSGMANGIDSIAQRTAIQQKNGSTIGVVAHGLKHIYPRQNQFLFQKAYSTQKNQNILLISEYPPFVKPLRYYFPRRNRIIAGLVEHLCCMEGGIKSGAMISVKYALEDGKYIYALDNKYMTNNQGGKALIEEGANNLGNIIKWEIINEGDLNKYNKKEDLHLYKYIGDKYWVRFYLNSNFQGFP